MKDVLTWFSLSTLIYENYHKSAATLGKDNLEEIGRLIGFPIDQFEHVPPFVLSACIIHTKTIHAMNRLMKGLMRCMEEYPDKGPDYYAWKVVYAILAREEIYTLCDLFGLKYEREARKAAKVLTYHTLKLYNDYEEVQTERRVLA